MVASSVVAPSPWDLQSNPAGVARQFIIRPIEDSATLMVNGQSVNLTSANLPATITIAQAFHNDALARVLTLQLTLANAGSARGINARIVGRDQFGIPRMEDITITGQAINTTRAYFTRWAYTQITSVTITAVSGGAAQAGDVINLGVCALTATAGTAGTQANGASSTHFQGFGLPVPLSLGTNPSGAASTLFTSELWGGSVSETAAAASTRAVLNRGAGFLVDSQYAVFVPQETFVLTGDGLRYLIINVQTNRGE